MNKHDRWVAGVKCQSDKACAPVSSACRLSFTGLLQHVDGWANARRWLARGRGSQQEHRALHLSLLTLRFRSPWTPLGPVCASPLGLGINRSSFKAAARAMDATIYQIIFGELGDLNCSLIDAFQDTFLETASLSLLSTDGKVELLAFFSCSILRGIAPCIRETIRVRIFFISLYFSPPRFILLQCHYRWDWNLLAAEQHREDCRETLPWVHQRGEVQHNE